MGDDRQIRPTAGIEELASLLDGQLSDHWRSERLTQLLSENSELKTEFDDQRKVKSILGELPEYREPEFMSTRVLAGIAARRELRRGSFLRNLKLAGGGATLFALGVGTAMQFYVLPAARTVAPTFAEGITPATGVFESTDALFETLPEDHLASAAALPEDMDPMLRKFLELSQEAHRDRQMQVMNNAVSPDMSSAVLVLDDSGN